MKLVVFVLFLLGAFVSCGTKTQDDAHKAALTTCLGQLSQFESNPSLQPFVRLLKDAPHVRLLGRSDSLRSFAPLDNRGTPGFLAVTALLPADTRADPTFASNMLDNRLPTTLVLAPSPKEATIFVFNPETNWSAGLSALYALNYAAALNCAKAEDGMSLDRKKLDDASESIAVANAVRAGLSILGGQPYQDYCAKNPGSETWRGGTPELNLVYLFHATGETERAWLGSWCAVDRAFRIFEQKFKDPARLATAQKAFLQQAGL